MAEERLQKILARAGVTSRRKAEELIVAGRVTVNGTVVDRLGSKADLDRDHVKVDGRRLRASEAAGLPRAQQAGQGGDDRSRSAAPADCD